MTEDEQKTGEEGKENKTVDDKQGETKEETKTISDLDRADQIVQMQKRENDRREELLKREENLQARKAVGGQTDAGIQPEKPKEETPKEYKDRIMKNEE